MRDELDFDPEERPQKRMPILILSTVIVVMLVITAAIALQKPRRAVSENKTPAASENQQEKWQEGVIRYQGKSYKYNSNIRAYLFMGVDKDEPVETAKDNISGGQSDAMFLVATNSADETISVITINRNAMTKIEICDEQGLNKTEVMSQICLQHGYGDGKHYSCSKSVDAVSYLFYNIPISGYLALNMGGIPGLNDSIGGVEVTVLQDLSWPDKGVDLHEGETVTLNGQEAYTYLRKRDTNVFDSASDRLRRQEQYITSFMAKAKTAIAGNADKALGIYNSISEYLVTDVDFVTLISELVTYDLAEDGVHTVPGETVMGDEFEEFYVDDDALYELIIQIFYEEVK
ncbi:MAG: LCP family protein [Coprococcus sp.]|nr:LCP family protein [Coprococcus sp.]